MELPGNSQNSWAAIQDFHRARRQAVIRDIIARLTGKSIGLLSYEEVRRSLRARGSAEQGLKEIPLDAIVGSVGRYNDFTRDFLPLQDETEDRWVRVNLAAHGQVGIPPIEVYQIGEVYFVLDGNHRVSVVRQLGASHIQAYVTEVKTKVPLTAEINPDNLIIAARYAEFLEETRLDELRPGADLTVTVPGQYRKLLEHIEVHRYFMGLDEKREISLEEATVHWYDTIYLPVVKIIRERGILDDFPGRTETDLYLWIMEHRAALEKELGWPIKPEVAASDLAAQKSPKPSRVAARLSHALKRAVVPDEFEAGPAPGEWRRAKPASLEEASLFPDLLVPVNGRADGWNALDQAILIAGKESAAVHGLHVVSGRTTMNAALAVKEEFDMRCLRAGVEGKLTLAHGSITNLICERARWVDLLVINLAYPPGLQPLARLSSGFRNLIRRCPSPILAVPGITTPLENALLAYDGSPKANEALFIAAYLAIKWRIALAVVTVIDEDEVIGETMDTARSYLESRGVQARYLPERGDVSQAVLNTAEQLGSDVIIMGGYGQGPVLEVVLGSSIDLVLRHSRKPILISR
jgi:nucleotide-binding universal stress UspA family protein